MSALEVPTELQHRVERFLYQEAMLLDEWRLEEWLALYTDDARYLVPSPQFPQGDPPEYPALIDDDLVRLRGRVGRLLGGHAHREYPFSRTRHLVSNVLVTALRDCDVAVSAAFVVYRARDHNLVQYVGRYRYTLITRDRDFRIREKRVELDMGGLWDQGTVSLLL